MDYFRVKSLVSLLQECVLSEEQITIVALSIVERCRILSLGAAKHNNTSTLAEIQAWGEIARSLLTKSQSAHSQADLRPRSDFSATLNGSVCDS